MSYPINYPTPQGANVQIFHGRAPNLTANNNLSWIKPQGASFVWFTLIGGGGSGDGTLGGGSGAVTNFMCPAFLIPDNLRIQIPTPSSSSSTKVRYQQKDGTGYDLLTANNGTPGGTGAAMTANYFTAMGFFQSIAGQAGTSGAVPASSTTFLSGGGTGFVVTANYGYTNGFTVASNSGFFQLQPIIVGTGGSSTANGGIGCGGGNLSGLGGNGMVVIITW